MPSLQLDVVVLGMPSSQANLELPVLLQPIDP